MLLPGYHYNLKIVRVTREGVWLDAAGEELWLPRLDAPGDAEAGSEIRVFLYLDRLQKLCATTKKPLIQVGEFALLQVKNRGPGGVFLDWGLEKDLFVPDPEQIEPMQVGRRYLVRACHDHENRPIASARLDKYLLQKNIDLRPSDRIDLIVWMFTDLGAKVIVNHLYTGLLYRDDLLPGLKRGDHLNGYVAKIRDDGKLDITLHPPGVAGIDTARAILLDRLNRDGFLPLTDQSTPENIRNQLGISKKLFKKAVGGLYKDGKILFDEKGIKLMTDKFVAE